MSRFAPGPRVEKHAHPVQKRLLTERLQQYTVGGPPGKRIGREAVDVAGYIKDLQAGVLAVQIGSQVEAAHSRHDHVDDGQAADATAFAEPTTTGLQEAIDVDALKR